ncbi:origin recognition complex subunit 2 [Hysterangium stoloniferum]|nr:origin recognition complex subunit 2 [Hysterangium stoloniferum]
MSTPRRITRQSVNTPSSKQSLSSPSRGKVIVITNDTPSRPAKRRGRPRKEGTSGSPQKTSPRKKRALAVSSRDSDSDEDEEHGSDDAESDEENGLISTLTKSAAAVAGKSLIFRNAFDAYFAAASKSSRTSNNVFSELVPPLSHQEYVSLLAKSQADSKNAVELQNVYDGHKKLFPRYALELAEGFNLLFYGFGSKRRLLNEFATTFCAKRGHVAVINGYMPRVSIKDIITSIEEIPGLSDVPLSLGMTGLEAQTRRIYDFFLPPAVRPTQAASTRPLFLLIHNIDSPLLRAPKSKALLSLLALNPRIHIIASVDHINAQMIWSISEASARKHIYDKDTTEVPPTRGFAWVWHDMTTMQHYDAELAHLDLTTIGRKPGKVGAAERVMSESAAQHILLSVNVKAKRLFVLLAKTLLASFDETGGTTKNSEKQLESHAVSYDALFNAARTDFIATNDTSFKALLAEFRDHELVLTAASGGSESLWIPLRVDELKRIVAGLSVEQ